MEQVINKQVENATKRKGGEKNRNDADDKINTANVELTFSVRLKRTNI